MIYPPVCILNIKNIAPFHRPSQFSKSVDVFYETFSWYMMFFICSKSGFIDIIKKYNTCHRHIWDTKIIPWLLSR